MSENNKGTFIKLYRKTLNNPCFNKKPFDDWRAFEYILLKARAIPTEVELSDGSKVFVERGQHFESRASLAEKFGWSIKKLRAWEKRMFEANMVTQKGTPRGNLYTVENYSVYQGLEYAEGHAEGHAKGQSEGQAEGQRKKKDIKNDYKERERESRARTREETLPWGRKQNVLLTIEEHEDLLNHFENADKLIDQVSNYLANATRIYPDHDALIWKIAEEDNWPKKKRAHRPAAEDYEIYRDEDGNEYARLKGVE